MRILLLCLVLAGCAEMPRTLYHWNKADGDQVTMHADWRACVAANSLSSRPVDSVVVHADGVDPDLAVACMKARGYSLVGNEAAAK